MQLHSLIIFLNSMLLNTEHPPPSGNRLKNLTADTSVPDIVQESFHATMVLQLIKNSFRITELFKLFHWKKKCENSIAQTLKPTFCSSVTSQPSSSRLSIECKKQPRKTVRTKPLSKILKNNSFLVKYSDNTSSLFPLLDEIYI